MGNLSDPKTFMKIKDLSLAAKTVIDGFMSGANRSAIKGPGLEFSQYRSYQPGDDLRWLDWKMYGRSDRYYIRESEVETNISIRLMIDASGSMDHVDNGYKKIHYARLLAASLAYLSNLQGDAVGLYVFQDDQLYGLTPRQDYQHLARIFFQLEAIKPGGKFAKPVNYRDIYTGTPRKELLVFITDFYQSGQEIIKLLDSLGSLKHEIIVLHLIGKNEVELDFQGYSVLQDLETGSTVKIDPDLSRKAYQNDLNRYLSAIRAQMLDRKIHYRLIRMDESPEDALRDFLKQRNKISG